MSKQSEKVKRYRKNTKNKMILSMGGKCQICGYSKCGDALEFHHVDEALKEFSFNQASKYNFKITKIMCELKKCILLCSRCHREVHAGITKLPEQYEIFSPAIFGYFEHDGVFEKVVKQVESKPITSKRKFEVSAEDLKSMLENQTLVSIGRRFGVSDNAVRKRARLYGILN